MLAFKIFREDVPHLSVLPEGLDLVVISGSGAREIPSAGVVGVDRGAVQRLAGFAGCVSEPLKLPAMAVTEAFGGNLAAALDDVADMELYKPVVMRKHVEDGVYNRAFLILCNDLPAVVILSAFDMLLGEGGHSIAADAGVPTVVVLERGEGHPAEGLGGGFLGSAAASRDAAFVTGGEMVLGVIGGVTVDEF